MSQKILLIPNLASFALLPKTSWEILQGFVINNDVAVRSCVITY